MRDSTLLKALKVDCARLARIRDLPEEQQKPYLEGILKLERRIEELRAACGMTLEDFVSEYVHDTMRAQLTLEEALKVDYDALWDHTYMASEAWKRADIDGINEARAGIRRVVFQAKKSEEGTT